MLGLYGMLECKVHVYFEILLLLNMAATRYGVSFIWKAFECMSSEEYSVH